MFSVEIFSHTDILTAAALGGPCETGGPEIRIHVSQAVTLHYGKSTLAFCTLDRSFIHTHS